MGWWANVIYFQNYLLRYHKQNNILKGSLHYALSKVENHDDFSLSPNEIVNIPVIIQYAGFEAF